MRVAVCLELAITPGRGDEPRYRRGRNDVDHIAPTFTRVTLRAASHVHADIMDAAGGTVRVVYDGRMDAGNRTMTIDASSLPAGNYFIRIETGDGIVAKTLVVAH